MGSSPEVQENWTWELAQKYFLINTSGARWFPGAAMYPPSTVGLTGISFLTAPAHLSPLISRLRFQASAEPISSRISTTISSLAE